MDDYSLWVDGGTLLLVADKVPLAQRQAVLDTLLYAQLVANKSSGSRFTQYLQWYKSYRQTLAKRGWISTQSYHESKPSSDYACLAPIQPLQLWLETRFSKASAIIERGVEQLARSQASSDCFRQYTVEGNAPATYATMEIGLVHPGPLINVCSIALKTSVAKEKVGISQLLAGETILGQVYINGLSAVLNHDQFEPDRENLRKLIASKEQAQRFILPVSTCEGEHHG